MFSSLKIIVLDRPKGVKSFFLLNIALKYPASCFLILLGLSINFKKEEC